jgi:hypothetical protein
MTSFVAGTTSIIPHPIPCLAFVQQVVASQPFLCQYQLWPCWCDVVRSGACFIVTMSHGHRESRCAADSNPAGTLRAGRLPLVAVRLLWLRLGGQGCHPAESAHQLRDPPALFVVVQALSGVALFYCQSVCAAPGFASCWLQMYGRPSVFCFLRSSSAAEPLILTQYLRQLSFWRRCRPDAEGSLVSTTSLSPECGCCRAVVGSRMYRRAV